MKKYKHLLYIGFAIMLICTASCKKYLNDNVNKATIPDATQWASEGNADLFLNGMYIIQLYNPTNSPDPLDNFTDDNDGGIYWTYGITKERTVDLVLMVAPSLTRSVIITPIGLQTTEYGVPTFCKKYSNIPLTSLQRGGYLKDGRGSFLGRLLMQ